MKVIKLKIGVIYFFFLLSTINYQLPTELFAYKIHSLAGTTAFNFLKIEEDAYFSRQGDIASLHPFRNGAGFHQSFWLQDLKITGLNYNTDGWAFSFFNLSVPNEIERRSGTGEADPYQPFTEGEGNFGARSTALKINRILKSVDFGAALLEERIDFETARGFALEAGYRYKNYGVRVENFGPAVKFIEKAYNLPLTVRLGAEKSFRRFSLLTELKKPIDDYLWWSAGLNYPAFSIFDLSMGYSYRFNGNPAGTLSGLGLGFGLNWKDFSLDYSYRNYDELGETHKLSFLWRFVMPGVKETEVPVTKKTGTLKWKLAGGDERGMMYSVEYKPEGKIVDRITMILPFTPEGDAIETWVEENVAGFRIEGIGGEILYFVNVRNDLGIQNLFVRYELRGIPPDCRAYFLKEKKDLPLKNENGRTLLETTALASFVIYRASPEPAPEGEAETKVRSAGEVYSEKGAGLMEKGEWSAAAECFRQAVEIDGKTQYFSSLGFCLGMRYFREKRYPEAKKAFEKVLRLEPGHRESLERLREIEKLVPKDGTVE